MAFNLVMQTIQTDTKNAIDMRMPLPALSTTKLRGAIAGASPLDWADAQGMWNTARINSQDVILNYANLLIAGSAQAPVDAAATVIALNFQTTVDALAAKYPKFAFRLFLHDNTYAITSPYTATVFIAATTNTTYAKIGDAVQERAVIGNAFANTYDNGGIFVTEYFSKTTKSLNAYLGGGVYTLNSSNASQVCPMFVLRLAITPLDNV
jgi:hypothetical protein